MRLFSYIFLFLLTTWQLIAQTYPVQVVPMLTPPYSSKIADYANPMANRVQLQLITTDLSVQNRSVQLYVEIKGNGLTAASAPVLSGVSPLRINGGEILRLTNAELASYFQLRNLQGITSQQYTSALPDGMYSFCFRVKDVLSGRWLSQSHCAIAYLMLNDPPILNIPTDNEQVAVTDFQNIIFSWTPRQINATNITYSFELREILDPTLDPRFAFEVSRRILKEDDLRMTTFVYDVSKPNLIPGRCYAWRVRAISTGGLAENSVFKNNGYSEVHSFVYAVNCSKPLFLLSQQQGKNRTKLLWQGHTLHQKYHIQYRKKGVANAQWFEASTRNTQTLITDLEAGEYEFRVGATCETERYGINPSYVYSDIQTFKIEKTQNTTESAYNCGIVPKIAITNQKPLGSLVTNEVFVAGDFSVTILEVSGNNGIFSGKGFIKVPYLNDTKLAVEFENVKINADYQLTDGVVKTTYDSDWKGVQFAENLIGQGEKSKDIDVPFEIEKVETRNGEIVVIGKDGRKEVFPFAGNDSSVKGKVTTTTNGVTTTEEKIYHIDKDGKVSTPQAVAQGGKPTKENTNGVTKEGEVTALTAKGIEVTFENTADSKYAYEVPTKAYSKDYQKMDGKYIPFKAVVKGETEPFLAKVHITDKNISADSLIFKTDKGALIESKRVEGSNDFLLTLKGFHSFAVEQVQATIKQGKKYQIAGVFNLVHLSPKTAKVVLVPTAENLSIDTDRVKAIYNKIGVTLDITWATPFDITPYLSDGVLETKDVFGDLTDYSLSQQKIIDAYKATGKVVNDTYYVFITNAKSSTGQGGYMALGGQFGFVFDQTARTLAHELGHGIFKLAHPFKKKQQGNVPSLMDYTSDEDLLFADWKQINDPAFKVGIFQGQSEGEYHYSYSLQKLLEWLKKNKGKIVNFDPLSTEYRWSGSKEVNAPSNTEFVDNNKELFFIKSLDVRNKAAKIDLSAIENIVLKTGYSVEFGWMTTTFYMEIYYAQGKDYAIKITTDNYRTLRKLLDFIAFEITKGSKEYIADKYEETLKKANDDKDKIDVLFENMPEFVFYKFSDETLWKYLQSLSKGSIDKIGTNEENAILNIVKNFKDKNFLYNKLYSTPELVYRIYSNLSEEGKDDYVHFLTKLTRDYKGKEEPKENEYAYVGEFETTDFPNYKKIWEGKSFYQYITPNKNDFSSTVNVHTEIVRANFLNVGSYEKHHTVNVVQNKNLLDKIYIYKGNRTQREVFPVIYVAYLGEKFDKEELLKTLNRASFLLGSYGAFRTLFVKGASTLVKTAAVVELSNLTISAYMQNESHRKEIENMGAGGKWFVENWSTISTLTDLATFSVAILDDLPKVSAKLQKEGVDTKELDTFVEKARREVRETITSPVGKQTSSLLSSLKNSKIEKLVKSWDKTLQEALEKDLLSKSMGGELRQLLKAEDDFLKWKLIKEDPAYAFELSKENSSWTKWGKSNFFKTNTQLGRQFESLVSSKIRNIPPFSTLYKDYTHLKQVYLKGVKDNIIADDLFVKKVFDEVEEVDYFRAIISDSKLKATSPWTANQKSELIDVFKNNPNKKYIEFEVRSSKSELQKFNLPENFSTGSRVRIYREDVYKIISEGDNIKIPPIKMNDINFK